jgi:hypothetical protein
MPEMSRMTTKMEEATGMITKKGEKVYLLEILKALKISKLPGHTYSVRYGTGRRVTVPVSVKFRSGSSKIGSP